jgi:hypothetical protein
MVWTVIPCVGPTSLQNVTDCAVSTLLKSEFDAVKLEINEGKTHTDWLINQLTN